MDVEKTKFDKKKVKQVAKLFKKSYFEAQKKGKFFDIPSKSLERDRTVEDTVGKYGSLTFGAALGGTKPEQLVQYWKSYKDHIEKYDEKIEDYKASILYDLEVLKNLIKARSNVVEQAKKFDSKKLEPHYWPMKGSENKELSKRCHDAVKAHEIEHHLDYLLKEEDFNVDDIKKAPISKPSYELLCDSNGKPKYIRCETCYKKFILSGDSLFPTEYSDMNIYNDAGGK